MGVEVDDHVDLMEGDPCELMPLIRSRRLRRPQSPGVNEKPLMENGSDVNFNSDIYNAGDNLIVYNSIDSKNAELFLSMGDATLNRRCTSILQGAIHLANYRRNPVIIFLET